MRHRDGRKRALEKLRPMALPKRPNHRWSLNFASDSLICGRRFRILGLVDGYMRECLALVANTSLSGARVPPGADRLDGHAWQATHGVSHGGADLTSLTILRWSKERLVSRCRTG